MEETMKCIKNSKTGNIVRVDDRQAYQIVGRTWQYVSKSEWKSSNRTPEPEPKPEVQAEEKAPAKKSNRRK